MIDGRFSSSAVWEFGYVPISCLKYYLLAIQNLVRLTTVKQYFRKNFQSVGSIFLEFQLYYRRCNIRIISEPVDLPITSERSSKMDFIIGVDDPPPTYAQIIEDTEEQSKHQNEQHQSDIQLTSNSNSSLSTRIGIS